MTKLAWLLVPTPLVASSTGVLPASIGFITTPLAILLGLVLLTTAERRKLVARVGQGEKVTMPKYPKAILAIFILLALALIFIGSLTKQ